MRPFPCRRAGRICRALSVITAAVLAAGCADDLAHPAEPGPAPLLASGSGFSGTYNVPIPATSHYNESPRWMPTGIVVPRDGVYRIRVHGSVTATLNESYKTVCNGGDRPDLVDPELLRTYGPRGLWRHGEQLFAVRVTSAPNQSLSSNYGFGEVDPQTMQADVFLRQGTQLYAFFYAMWAGVSCPEDGTGTYNLTGSHTLTATEVVKEPARLVLECNDTQGAVSVERGATLSCHAKTEPEGGAVTDARWTFQDTRGDGPVIPGPQGEDAWSGPMVVGGTVTLAAKVNGEQQSATAAVTVTKRAWRDALPELRTVYCPAAGVATCPLNNPPVYDKDMGATGLGPAQFILRGTAVQGGPNTGWNYIPGQQGPIRFTRFVIYLNVVLQDPGNPLFRGGCSVGRVTQWITDHENVHVRKIRRAIDQQRMNPELEDVVAFSADDFQRELRRADARIVRLLSDIGDGNHSDNDYPSDPCNLPLKENP